MPFSKALRDNGSKVTKTRKHIMSWIVSYDGVFSAKEIMDALPSLDKVSVYRTLELFEELDLIHPVLTQHGEKHYEMHGENHHHHVVCTGCEKASCVDCHVKRSAIKGFTNIHHSVVYTGLCSSCNIA